LIDVDHFKRVNDTLGHYMGDILLKQLAVVLTKNIRPSDTVGRLGGDEFALVLPNVSHPDGSTVVLDKIFKALEETIMVEGHELHISISVGISAYPDDGTDLATLLRHADEAMYDAKAAGRNNFQIYNNPKTLNLVRRES
jgi:diguanylate cyclase (GGDEF)-like protein